MTLPRGFEVQEFQDRTARAQALMQNATLSALVLTTEPEIRYFTGFLTRFWESPTRPWFLIVPASSKPIAVIPSIGAHLMGQTWIDDIRTWDAPNPADDGISLLAATLNELGCDQIGTPMGPETHLRMPLADFERLKAACPAITHDAGIIRSLRMIKSPAEIAKIRQSCTIAGRAFARIGDILSVGTPFDEVFRRFQMLCLNEGADAVPYLAGGFGPDGYGDVISPASSTPVKSGDVVMLDTGLSCDGYFCDFDRNFALSRARQEVRDGYARLIEATDAALEMAQPGRPASDLFHVMDKVLTGGKGGTAVGRYGHGLGMQLTEWPSLTAKDHTEMSEGMVLTLEPCIATAPNSILVHEENIVITKTGAEMLSPSAPRELPILP